MPHLFQQDVSIAVRPCVLPSVPLIVKPVQLPAVGLNTNNNSVAHNLHVLANQCW